MYLFLAGSLFLSSIMILLLTRGLYQNKIKLFEESHQLGSDDNDQLTGLPNRKLLTNKIKRDLISAKYNNSIVAVGFIDLDNFRKVNDHHGYDFGDFVLACLSEKMARSLRDTDYISRLGGDEFVVVFSGVKCNEEAEARMNQLLIVINDPIESQKKIIKLHASVGISSYPQDGDIEPDQLIRQADRAMYSAKQSGRNSLVFFDTNHDLKLRQQQDMILNLKTALDLNQLILFYQPKINLLTGEILGVEALVRWQHPEKGLIEPSKFLPIIEQHIFAIELGDWIIRRAIHDCHQWQLSGIHIPVAVNIFPIQLKDEEFIHRLESCLSTTPDFNSEMLEFEIIETAALDDIDKASRLIKRCKSFGVYFTLDDFGTGYSSLTYLRRLPIEKVKLDKSFVMGMLVDADDVVIVQGVLNMAKALGLEVIAEGVETFEHGEKLIGMGCNHAQGYAIAKPMPKDEILKWVEQWALPVQWKSFDID